MTAGEVRIAGAGLPVVCHSEARSAGRGICSRGRAQHGSREPEHCMPAEAYPVQDCPEGLSEQIPRYARNDNMEGGAAAPNSPPSFRGPFRGPRNLLTRAGAARIAVAGLPVVCHSEARSAGRGVCSRGRAQHGSREPEHCKPTEAYPVQDCPECLSEQIPRYARNDNMEGGAAAPNSPPSFRGPFRGPRNLLTRAGAARIAGAGTLYANRGLPRAGLPRRPQRADSSLRSE